MWMSCLHRERPAVLRALLPAFFLTALLPGAPVSDVRAESRTVWYRSNEDFMDLDPLPERAGGRGAAGGPGGVSVPGAAGGPGSGWLLAVRRDEDDPRREIRTLYLDGEEQGWEETLHTVRGLLVEVRRFRYRDEGSPEELFRLEITYRADNTLRSVRRCAGEECILIRYAPPGEAGLESIRGSELLLGIRYGESGRPEYIRREQPGEPVEEEWFEYDRGRLASSRTVTGPREQLRRYAEGLLVLQETRRDRLLVERVSLDRATDGTLLRETRETRNRVEVDQFFPDLSEGIVRERRVNGVLVEQEEITAPGERVVTRLQGGEILFRTWFGDDEPHRREIYFDGEILRVERLGE
jgi:hypothetical protein